jgi:hypothetical protein
MRRQREGQLARGLEQEERGEEQVRALRIEATDSLAERPHGWEGTAAAGRHRRPG